MSNIPDTIIQTYILISLLLHNLPYIIFGFKEYKVVLPVAAKTLVGLLPNLTSNSNKALGLAKCVQLIVTHPA